MNSPHRGQWRGALMLSLVYAWINGWVNKHEAGDLRRHRTHYDFILMHNGFRVPCTRKVNRLTNWAINQLMCKWPTPCRMETLWALLIWESGKNSARLNAIQKREIMAVWLSWKFRIFFASAFWMCEQPFPHADPWIAGSEKSIFAVLFASEDRLWTNLRVQEQPTNMVSQCLSHVRGTSQTTVVMSQC